MIRTAPPRTEEVSELIPNTRLRRYGLIVAVARIRLPAVWASASKLLAMRLG
jgi:hypothetical protein